MGWVCSHVHPDVLSGVCTSDVEQMKCPAKAASISSVRQDSGSSF